MIRDDIPFPPAADEVARLRVPPHSVEAEQSVLGALLLDNRAFDRISDKIAEADFFRSEHRVIWAAMQRLILASKTADVITVHVELGDKSDDVGGIAYLNALFQSVPGSSAIERYADLMRGRSVLRQTIAKADEIATAAFKPNAEASDVLNLAATGFGAIERTTTKSVPVLVGSLMTQRLDHVNDLHSGKVTPGEPTGIDELDDMLGGGLKPGYYVIAARPGMGKSALSQQLLLTLAGRGKPTLFLSQEMPATTIADRALANIGGISLGRLQSGKLQRDEWASLAEAADRLRSMPFHVDDQPSLRLVDIRAKARAVKNIGAVVLDYIQLCTGEGETRNQQLEEISRGLIALRKELDCPVIVLSQLNREVEKRANKRPIQSDLRDCGGIEQDADVIMFLYPSTEPEQPGVRSMNCAVDKNRSGPTGDMLLQFQGWSQRFYAAERTKGRGYGAEGGFD